MSTLAKVTSSAPSAVQSAGAYPGTDAAANQPADPAATRSAQKAAFPILMYHQIAPPPPRTQPLWTLNVAPAKFAAQMQWMHRLGYRGLSMRDLLPYLAGEKKGKVFGITFDDGFLNVLQHAAPVLQQLGFTSTCYFVAGQMGGANVWDAHLGIPATPLMDRSQLQRWVALGQEVGSHTVDHCHLPALPAQEALQQITSSKETLEALSGQTVESFCYPYGDANTDVQAMVRDCGYTNATMTHKGHAASHHDRYDLPRVTVSSFTSLPKFLYKCLA